MKRFFQILVLAVGLLIPSVSHAQLQKVSFNDLDSLVKKEKRKIVVFIHTDWCKFCLQMKNTTFKSDSVIKLLNKNFYFVSFNAESKEDVVFQGHTFKYKPTGASTGVHELARQLGTIKGKLNYPTISILNKKNEITFQYGGLMKTNELLAVLRSSLK